MHYKSLHSSSVSKGKKSFTHRKWCMFQKGMVALYCIDSVLIVLFTNQPDPHYAFEMHFLPPGDQKPKSRASTHSLRFGLLFNSCHVTLQSRMNNNKSYMSALSTLMPQRQATESTATCIFCPIFLLCIRMWLKVYWARTSRTADWTRACSTEVRLDRAALHKATFSIW